MRLLHKIEKLRNGQAWGSSKRHLLRRFYLRHSSVPLDPESLSRTIEGAAFDAIKHRYAVASPNEPWMKYFDLSRWIPENLRRVHGLDLDCGRRKRILDLGCGPGYFLFISRCLGHDVVGLDLDEAAIFREMIALLGLHRVTWRVRPFVRLPRFGKKFDLIAAFMICFNGHKSRELWGPEEWHFFLDDLETQLSSSGRICLGFNRESDGRFYSEELCDYFVSRGGELEKNRVLLTQARKTP